MKFIIIILLSIISYTCLSQINESWILIKKGNETSEYIWSKYLEKRPNGVFKVWTKTILKTNITPFLNGINYDSVIMKCLLIINIPKNQYKRYSTFFYNEYGEEITVRNKGFDFIEEEVEWRDALPESYEYNLLKKASKLFQKK